MKKISIFDLRTFSAVISVICLASVQFLAAPLTLVSKGTGEYTIIVSKDASLSEKWAAEELVDHIKQMSGAVLPVQEEGGVLPEKAVILGDGPAARSLGIKVELQKLGEDGYQIKTAGKRLVIAGGRRRGTMYGVYTVLEKLGVRWWTPSETSIPKLTTIIVPELDLLEIPKLIYRDMMNGNAWDKNGKLWMARNKLNGMSWESGPDQEKLGGRYEYIGRHFLHGSKDLLLGSGVAITKDMWQLLDGERRPNTQPCYTNPEVVKAVTAGVIKEQKAHPDAKFTAVSLDTEGIGKYCQCKVCTELAEKEGPAGLLIRFANQVAEGVEREIPGAKIVTSAYSWACNPPKTLRPRDNVIIAYDTLSGDYAHPLSSKNDEDIDIENNFQPGSHYYYRPGENKRVRREVEGWSKISGNMLLYDYTVSLEHPYMPYPDLDVLVPNIKYYSEHNFKGIFILGSLSNRGAEFYGLRMWVEAKALWNPEAGGQALISEFLNGYYGAAAPAIQKYIDVLHKVPRENKEFYLPFHGGYLNSLHLRPETIAAAEQVLREAEKLAKGDLELEKRVRHAHLPVWYILAKRGPESVTWKLTEEKAGMLDLQELAKNYLQVKKEQGADKLPAVDWLSDYAALGGKAIPPELKDVDSKKYRLIQACQMDGDPQLWQRTPEASDGWCEVLKSPAFGVWLGLTPGEEYTPGKKYKIFARVKAEGKFRKGQILYCSVSNSKNGKKIDTGKGIMAKFITLGLPVQTAGKEKELTKSILYEDLDDGQFHAIEIGEVVDPAFFTVNYAAVPGSGKLFFDCFWLIED